MLALVAALTLGGAGAMASARRPKVIVPETPFPVGVLAGSTLDGTRRIVGTDSATTVLYVSAGCRYCRAELAAWAERRALDPTLTLPLVVVAPDRPREVAATFVSGYPGDVLLDTDGAIGRALGAKVVPWRAEIRAGSVVRVEVGLSGAPGEAPDPGRRPDGGGR